jgi:hypothetical protein
MAAPEGAPRSGWDFFDQLHDELQQAIAQLVGAAGIKSWRATCRAARQLLNARVRRASIDAVELPRLSLVQRFPGLQRLNVGDADGSLTDTTFAEFALVELAALTSLDSLQLRGCKALGTAGLVALERYCPQLRGLALEGAGATPPLLCSQPFLRLSLLA